MGSLSRALPSIRVPKFRFGSKYSSVLRSPHKLKFAGTPSNKNIGAFLFSSVSEEDFSKGWDCAAL